MTLFRHGARAPTHLYNKTKYDYILNEWDNPGELTGIGQRMHFLLGWRNRIKYINEEKFLSEKFDPHEILIYSTCINRTILSAASQLQGLYPQSIKKGETLTKEQIELAKPPVNISIDIIKNELSNMDNYALPNSMILAPIRMINLNEKRMRLYDIDGCKNEINKIKKDNEGKHGTLKKIKEEFKEKYGENAKNLYGEELEYDLDFLSDFCDAFISGDTELKPMDKLLNAGFNLTDLREYCQRFKELKFRDWILGDDKGSEAHLEVSKVMNETLHYLRQRLEIDKNNINYESKKDDFSKPKMVMYSAHDTTIACFEVFLKKALNKDDSFFKYPQFATQISFELVTNKNKEETKKDEDYTLNFYYDDELKVSMTMNEFIEKITKKIWTEIQVNKFCNFNDSETKKLNKDDDKKNSYKLYIIIFGSLTALLLILNIIMSVKLIKGGNKESKTFDSLMPANEE